MSISEEEAARGGAPPHDFVRGIPSSLHKFNLPDNSHIMFKDFTFAFLSFRKGL